MPSRYDHFRTHYQTRRLRDYDYARTGCYFVTACTKDGLPLLGGIRDGIVGLSAAGCIAYEAWHAVTDSVSHVHAEAFIVMPNHVHALIALNPEESSLGFAAPNYRTSETLAAPPARSLGVLVGSFKALVTRKVRASGLSFAWQPRYHDHIVRSDEALRRIRAYIESNPSSWKQDCFHPTPYRRDPITAQ